MDIFIVLCLLQLFAFSYGGLTPRRANSSEDTADSTGRGYTSQEEDDKLKVSSIRKMNWTVVSDYSKCSVTCGRGIKTRPLQCLDEDGVVSQDCSIKNKPASYKFCNQIECVPNGELTYSKTKSKSSHQLKEKRSIDLSENYLAQRTSISSLNIINTRDFTITVDSGHIFLSHKGQQLLDLTDLKRITLTISEIVTYRNGIISVSSGIKIRHFSGMEELLVYNGTALHILTPSDKDIYLVTMNGKLFVCGKKALYSRSRQFNELLSNQLSLISSKTKKGGIPVKFRALIGGEFLLIIDSNPIVIITNTQFRSISDRQFLLYFNSTLHIRDITKKREEMFPEVDELSILNRLAEGTEKHNTIMKEIIPGGGQLYFHMPTRKAFYSKDLAVNRKIDEFLSSQMQPDDPIVFSIHFNAVNNGGGMGALDVTVSANGVEIVRLRPNVIVDQSVSLQHYIVYDNSTVYIQEGDLFLDVIENIHKIKVYNGNSIMTFTTTAPNEIPGGGQIFSCQNIGFYSVDADLNDRIGDALMAAADENNPAFADLFAGAWKRK